MLKIIPRAEWGARTPARAPYHINLPTPELWIHHTADESDGPAGVRATQNYHMDVRGWSDVAYSFLVDDDGAIYEGRGFGIAGGHTAGHNTISHALCGMGNFDVRQPTIAMLNSMRELVHYGIDNRYWTRVSGGHRDASGASTACPGKYLYAQLPYLSSAIPVPALEGDLDELHTYIVARKVALIVAWYQDHLGRVPGDSDIDFWYVYMSTHTEADTKAAFYAIQEPPA